MSANTRDAVQRLRETTASKLFKADAKFAAKLDGFGKGSVEAEFLSKIKHAYTETGAFEKTEEEVQKHEEKMKLAPGEKVTIYENTTEGGGYQHNWETTEPMTEAEKKPVTVRLFVTRDYTPILNEILLSVIQDTAGISTDSDEWGAYSRICQLAKTKEQPLYGYINAILENGSTTSKLWTTGLDQDSWASVISAARKARTVMGKTDQSNPAALRILLLGFYNVRSPSHNAWAWDHLKAISGKYLRAQ